MLINYCNSEVIQSKSAACFCILKLLLLYQSMKKTEHLQTYLRPGNSKEFSAPPGFPSHTSFLLKKVDSHEGTCGSMPSLSTSKQNPIQMNITANTVDIATLKSTLGDRPWILYDHSSHKWEESGSGQPEKVIPTLLPPLFFS